MICKPTRRREHGASLLLALLLLTLLSALVAHALEANQWQRRIASHEIARVRAEAAAQSALGWAEQWLMSLPGDAPPDCVGSCESRNAVLGQPPEALAGLDRIRNLDERWWMDFAHADGVDPLTGRRLAPPGGMRTPAGRWIVVPLAIPAPGAAPVGDDDVRSYRVLARAVPNRRGDPVLLESVVARPWGDVRWRDPLPANGSAFCNAPDTPQPCGRLRWQQRP